MKVFSRKKHKSYMLFLVKYTAQPVAKAAGGTCTRLPLSGLFLYSSQAFVAEFLLEKLKEKTLRTLVH